MILQISRASPGNMWHLFNLEGSSIKTEVRGHANPQVHVHAVRQVFGCTPDNQWQLAFKSVIFFGRVWAILNWHEWTITWEDWEWIQIYSLANNWPCWKNPSIFTMSRCEHFSNELGRFNILEVRGNKIDYFRCKTLNIKVCKSIINKFTTL